MPAAAVGALIGGVGLSGGLMGAGLGAAAGGLFQSGLGGASVQTPTVSQMTQGYGETAAQILQDQINLAPQQYAASAQWSPQYAQLYNNILQQSLMGTSSSPGLLSIYSQSAPQLQDISSATQKQQLEANLANLQNLGPGAVQAFQQANPQLASLQGQMAQLGQTAPAGMVGAAQTGSAQANAANLGWSLQNPLAVGTMFNPSLAQLQGSTMSQLAQGGTLSQQDVNNVTNQTLSAMNQQGRAYDPMAVAQMALNLDATSLARLQSRQAAAAQTAGLVQNQGYQSLAAQQSNQAAQLQAQGLGLQGAATQAGYAQQANLANAGYAQQALMQNAAYQQQAALANQQAQLANAQFQGNMLNTAANSYLQTTLPAFNTVLGTSNALPQSIQSAAQAYGMGSQGYQNYNPYGIASGLYGDYYGALQNANISNANLNAGLLGGGMNLLSSVLPYML